MFNKISSGTLVMIETFMTEIYKATSIKPGGGGESSAVPVPEVQHQQLLLL